MASKEKGWFVVDGRAGDRTLEQQLQGLVPLFQMVPDRTVLDVGCAEGLISLALAKAGARKVHGLDVVPQHIDVAKTLARPPVSFELADANSYRPQRRYDIVVMLAVLHKLADPAGSLLRLADAATQACVIRLPPPDKPKKEIDGRGPCSAEIIARTMRTAGFRPTDMTMGPFNEPTYYWAR